MKSLLILFLIANYLFAKDNNMLSKSTSTISSTSIPNLISQIKSAPQSQKRELINQLKIRLKSSNALTRKNAIKELRGNHYKHKFQQKYKNHSQNGMHHRLQLHKNSNNKKSINIKNKPKNHQGNKNH
jgi:hypothetical protein